MSCRIAGPYYPVGDVDWMCRTHNELAVLKDRARFGAPDLRPEDFRCPRSRARVILFKPSGKFYTEEEWDIPEGAIGPYDMADSPHFRRISGGPVLVVTQEPWGYPHLFPARP